MFEDEYKEPTPWWVWFLVALTGILFFLVAYTSINFKFGSKEKNFAVQDSTRYDSNDLVSRVNLTMDETGFDEITRKDIFVRGNEQNAIYTTSLFKPGEVSLDATSRIKLQQIARSVTKRFNNGPIKVYSYADTTGTSAANTELTRQRAIQVRNWLIQQGGVPAANITLFPEGESKQGANNTSLSRNDFDRRIEIVALADKSGFARTAN